MNANFSHPLCILYAQAAWEREVFPRGSGERRGGGGSAEEEEGAEGRWGGAAGRDGGDEIAAVHDEV